MTHKCNCKHFEKELLPTENALLFGLSVLKLLLCYSLMSGIVSIRVQQKQKVVYKFSITTKQDRCTYNNTM